MANIKKRYMDYLRAGDSDKLSSSVLWFHIANLAVTVMYILMGFAVYHSKDPNIMDYALLTAVYAGIVTGNKFANAFLSYKYAVNTSGSSTTETETNTNVKKKEVKHDVVDN